MPGAAMGATVKSRLSPSSVRATAIAVAEAPSAAMAMRVSKRRTNSSSTKMAPAIGALKAVARPAPAPAASSMRQSSQSQRNHLPTRWASVAPIWTLGPSRPRARPPPMASVPPTNLTGMRRKVACFASPASTASTWGMPLPDASRAKRRTRKAAMPAEAAASATTARKPATEEPCAAETRSPRSVSARSRAKRKAAPIAPASAPASGARIPIANRLPLPSCRSAASGPPPCTSCIAVLPLLHCIIDGKGMDCEGLHALMSVACSNGTSEADVDHHRAQRLPDRLWRGRKPLALSAAWHFSRVSFADAQ